jgi:hypothetical protein
MWSCSASTFFCAFGRPDDQYHKVTVYVKTELRMTVSARLKEMESGLKTDHRGPFAFGLSSSGTRVRRL